MKPKSKSNEWQHFLIEGHATLSLHPVPKPRFEKGSAIVCTDDPELFEICSFDELLERVKAGSQGEQIQAFVHANDLRRFADFMAPLGKATH